MKDILFFSPDLNLCASLLMFFNEKYSVTTTTNLDTLKHIVETNRFDLLVIDAEPSDKVEELCRDIHEHQAEMPVVLTYVYTIKYKNQESNLRAIIDAIFYKPFDLFEVSQKIDHLLQKAH